MCFVPQNNGLNRIHFNKPYVYFSFDMFCIIKNRSPGNTDVMTPVYLVRFVCHLLSYYQVYLIWSHCSQ